MSSGIKINSEEITEYFKKFDGFSHKLYRKTSIGEDVDLDEKLARLFYSGNQRDPDFKEAQEIFQTMDKVYHYDSDKTSEEMYLLEKTAGEFLAQYADIDGLQELFRSSYFYFEWMMHLEYMRKRHDYSYYRDHYMHQIRNLYEMFLFLQEEDMWRDCMEIYRQRGSIAANRMADAVKEQRAKISEECSIALQKSFGDLDEWCYHYIIFSTAIISSVVHDIGYPLTYMKRNLSALQDFLPLSQMFMGLEDGIPRIKGLLSGSLLFASADNDEIIRRLNADDHGAYSAVILLCQYYDSGKIFSLEPMKRMVIELSALVIYNHTLRYHFQKEREYDRYQNIFAETPVSYLFRLCDDMQEWERVYFEITGKSTFFVCNNCKGLMLRSRNPLHRNEDDAAKDGKLMKKRYEYECACGAKAINTVWFPYRRMMNVSPFTEAVLAKYGQETSKGAPREAQKWILELKCDKGALLQLARYNPDFAIQRARGIRELKGLLRGQKSFPRIFVKAFLSSNPVAIKAEILREYLQNNEKKLEESLTSMKQKVCKAQAMENLRECWEIMPKIKDFCSPKRIYNIYSVFINEYKETFREEWVADGKLEKKSGKKLRRSIGFYLFLLLVCEVIGDIDLKSEAREEYELSINSEFMQCAETIAQLWEIKNLELVDLISDCLACMYGKISEDDFFEKRSTCRYDLRIPLRVDMKEILKKYTRWSKDEAMDYDYYSDYYLFYMMDCLNSRR